MRKAGSSRWKWEAEKMIGLEGCEGWTPAMLYRQDIGAAVKNLESQGVCVILGGDFNFAWSKNCKRVSCGGEHAAEWKR